ncbi:MAG: hypothetical protein K2X86_04160 [Cytophagaceae bacterium]|nr:hypothetical protein [Cytophagaceae bacterium]
MNIRNIFTMFLAIILFTQCEKEDISPKLPSCKEVNLSKKVDEKILLIKGEQVQISQKTNFKRPKKSGYKKFFSKKNYRIKTPKGQSSN